MPGGDSDLEKTTDIVHATCVSLQDRGLLILGRSGSGKSALALQMLGLGCELVADDRVALTVQYDSLIADAPPKLPSLIEARGVGILQAKLNGPAMLVAVVDMNKLENVRLPKRREIVLKDRCLPLFYKIEGHHFAAAMVQLLKHGWHDPE